MTVLGHFRMVVIFGSIALTKFVPALKPDFENPRTIYTLRVAFAVSALLAVLVYAVTAWRLHRNQDGRHVTIQVPKEESTMQKALREAKEAEQMRAHKKDDDVPGATHGDDCPAAAAAAAAAADPASSTQTQTRPSTEPDNADVKGTSKGEMTENSSGDTVTTKETPADSTDVASTGAAAAAGDEEEEVPEMTTMTVHDYDWKQFLASVERTALSLLVLTFLHFQFGFAQPLIHQCLIMPGEALLNPVTQIHLLGLSSEGSKARTRPFPK